jgi:hypothetical protein
MARTAPSLAASSTAFVISSTDSGRAGGDYRGSLKQYQRTPSTQPANGGW